MFLLVGISLISVIGFTILAVKNAESFQLAKTFLTKNAAESILDKIDRNLFERYGDVQAFALSEPARSGDSKRISSFIDDMMVTYAPIYDAMIVVDKNGRVIAVNSVDKTGKSIETSMMIDADYSQKEWFKTSMSDSIKPGSSLVEDLHIDEDVAKFFGKSGQVMNFTAPIRDKITGEIIGVWTNRVSWEDVVQAITKEEAEKLKTNQITFVEPTLKNKNGHVIFSSGNKITEETISATSSSKGYSIYPGIGWNMTIEIPASDLQMQKNMMVIVLVFIFLLAGVLVGFRLIQSISKTLNLVCVRLRAEANAVEGISKSVSASSETLANTNSVQASALATTAASIEELRVMIQKNNDSTKISSHMANKSLETATLGNDSVAKVIESIDNISKSNIEITQKVEESHHQFNAIMKVIAEIGAKTKIINDIVFQTKLLSFNASVEAARAGEHGKGFSVVAEEVGKLAQMSGNASKEITMMLDVSIQKVENIVKESKMNLELMVAKGKKTTDSGIEIAKECSQILQEVVKNVRSVNTMLETISIATHEQAKGTEEISKAMIKIDQVMHENKTTSESTASSSSQLLRQSKVLIDEVDLMEKL